MPSRPIKPSTTPKRPVRLVAVFVILLALSHLPSLAHRQPLWERSSQKPTPELTITSSLRRKENPTYNLEMRWGIHNYQERICRIHDACITRNSIAIHPWMKPHIHHLHACGIRNISFLNPASQPTFQPLDLFGIIPARYHIPHFLTDILPMVYASTLLKESLAKDVKAVCETPHRGRCRPRGVTPGLLVEDRALKLPSTSWVKQLSKLLPGQPRMVGPDEGCYKSIVAYKRSFYRRGRRWYSRGELFERAGVNRGSVVGKCSPHVVILNRVGWIRRGGILLGRDILNVDQVAKRIGERAPKYRLNVTVEIAYFENRTFEEQIGIVQRADVLLGVHGAGLANLLFAKLDVPLLEVLPFGYYAGPFDRLASALYLNYSRIIAEPDDESFMDCLKKRADKSGLQAGYEEDVGTWKKALDDWNDSGNENVLQTHLLTSQRNSSMKICARGQRLHIDATKTADRLLDMAVGICRHGPVES